MKIEVANGQTRSGEGGIISLKPESAAEILQLDWLLKKAESLRLDAFAFTGWDDDGGGITFVTKLVKDS